MDGPSGRSPVVATLTELSRRLGRVLEELSADRPPGVVGYHDLHRQLRIIRLEISVDLRTVPRGKTREIRAIDGEIRRLTRLTGEVRDRDVGLRLLSPPSEASQPMALAKSLRTARRTLSRESLLGRQFLAAHARRLIVTNLPERLATASRGAARPRTVRWRRGLERERTRRWRRLRRAIRAVGAKRDLTSLHVLRSRIRALRLATALRRPAGHAGKDFPRTLRRLQRQIGDLHDVAVLERRLGRFRGQTGVRQWWRLVRRREHLRIGLLVRSVISKRVRDAVELTRRST